MQKLLANDWTKKAFLWREWIWLNAWLISTLHKIQSGHCSTPSSKIVHHNILTCTVVAIITCSLMIHHLVLEFNGKKNLFTELNLNSYWLCSNDRLKITIYDRLSSFYSNRILLRKTLIAHQHFANSYCWNFNKVQN